MSREFQVYSGAAPQSAQVQAKQVPYFGNIPQNGAAVDAAIGEVQELGVKIGRLHDLGLQQRVTQERERIRSEMEVEMRQAADVAWGSEESLFRKDGSVNSDRYDAIVAKYWEECDRIEPGEFKLGDNAVRYAGEQEALRNDIALGMMKFTALKTLENTRMAFSDNLALAVGREDWEAARGLVEDARGSLLNDTEAEIELLKLKRGQLRALGAATRSGVVPPVVTLGGKEFSGANAALAMVRGSTAEPSSRGSAEAGVVRGTNLNEGVVTPEEPAVPQQVSAWDGGVPEAISLDAYTLLPESEQVALVEDFTFDRKVLTLTDDWGKEHFSCPVTAPEAVQRVVAQAELKGEPDVDTCRGMVARITMDAAVENPEVTTEQVLKQFDDSGIYAAMGGGDAEVGKARTRAIVEEMRQRAQAGTTKVNMATIQRMVNAQVQAPDFGQGQEWKAMEALDPGLKKKDGKYPEWEKGDDAQRKKWFALYDLYRKYRREYMPTATGEPDKDEFNEHAGAFYEWYKANVYKQQKEAAQAAARDYYTAVVVERLRDSVDVDREGKAVYAGYANEVAVARDVLSKPLPGDLGVAAVAQRERAIEQDSARAESFRQTAKEDYERLRGLKQAEAENSEAARKAKERQDAAQKRAEQKEAREAEKRAEQQEARRLFVARSQPRDSEWVWDGENAPDGEQPLCTVPVEEYHRLQQELGYDGTQLVYLRVGSGKVLVVGTNDTGKIQLNTPAVMKIQARPNAKKGEKWRINGRLGYSYQFANAK